MLDIICLCITSCNALFAWIIAIGANKPEALIVAIVAHLLQIFFISEIIKKRR